MTLIDHPLVVSFKGTQGSSAEGPPVCFRMWKAPILVRFGDGGFGVDGTFRTAVSF